MNINQPTWECIANLGDAAPFEYGGYFVLVDTTGRYAPTAEYLEINEDGGTDLPYAWLYRFVLEPCTFINGILSDNPFHPDKPAWFAGTEDERTRRPQDTTYFGNLSSSADVPEDELIAMFTSSNPLERAHAWRTVGDYHGWDNLDSYPLTFSNRFRLERYRRKYRTVWTGVL